MEIKHWRASVNRGNGFPFFSQGIEEGSVRSPGTGEFESPKGFDDKAIVEGWEPMAQHPSSPFAGSLDEGG